jgi:hypothetical protein
MASMNRLTILVSSCDDFSDCWGPYCHGLEKYWPDCPYDVFIVTNDKDVADCRAKALRVGDDKGWSANTMEALRRISSPYVFYTHEDFWISKPVDTHVIEDYLDIMERDKADYVRLYPAPPPDNDFPDDWRLGTLSVGASYRTALQVALWRKTVLEELIVPGEDPWQFELQGTPRSRKYGERFLCVKPFFDQNNERYHYGVEYVCTAINKGRWSKAAKKYALKEGLAIDFSNRRHEGLWHDFTRSGRLGQFCGRAVYIMTHASRNPKKAVRKIRLRLRDLHLFS